MKRERIHEGQMIYSMLVNGFNLPAGSCSPDKVKTFRQERLKQLVLGSVFEGYGNGARRAMAAGSRYV